MFKSLGFDGKGQVSGLWMPSGTYRFLGGVSLPSRSYISGSIRLEGSFVWGCYSEGYVYLLDSLSWNNCLEVDDFFNKPMYDGFVLRFMSGAGDNLSWRNIVKFSELDENRQPRFIYLDKLSDVELGDIILRFLHLGRLKYERGGLMYKKLGLFLTNPKLELDAFLESLGYLLSGIEVYYR